jgi:ABC-type Fe3+/spermidine/putrescine transport system ATPase subunit
MRLGLALSGAAAGLVMTAAVALAQPALPACDSPEARTGVDFALKKSNAPFTITGMAGITTDKQTDTEVMCLAIATLSNGSHRPIGYKFRIYDGKVQSWVGMFVMKGSK